MMLKDSLEEDTVVTGKELINIEQKGEKVILYFADGTTDEADLVIGADGIRSTVRKKLFKDVPAKFTGYRCLYAVAPSGTRKEPSMLLQDYRSGYMFGTWTAGGEKSSDIAVHCFKTKTAQTFDWTKEDGAREEYIRILDERKAADDVRTIVTNAQRVFDWSLYTLLVEEPWSKGRIVLLGDAAHATSPFVGQGANQAMQDAYCLVDKLLKHNHNHQKAFEEFEKIRKPHCANIIKVSGAIGAVETASWPFSILRDKFMGTSLMIKVLEKSMHPVI
jgi:salicylate hydroxylase